MKKNVAALQLLVENGIYILVGELTRHTVPSLPVKKVQKSLTADNVIFNFKGVEKVDTAGLAWVCALLEQANEKQCQLSLVNFPEQLTKLAKLSGVENFLPTT